MLHTSSASASRLTPLSGQSQPSLSHCITGISGITSPHPHGAHKKTRMPIGTSAAYTTSKFAGKKSANFENRQKRTFRYNSSTKRNNFCNIVQNKNIPNFSICESVKLRKIVGHISFDDATSSSNHLSIYQCTVQFNQKICILDGLLLTWWGFAVCFARLIDWVDKMTKLKRISESFWLKLAETFCKMLDGNKISFSLLKRANTATAPLLHSYIR